MSDNDLNTVEIQICQGSEYVRDREGYEYM